MNSQLRWFVFGFLVLYDVHVQHVAQKDNTHCHKPQQQKEARIVWEGASTAWFFLIYHSPSRFTLTPSTPLLFPVAERSITSPMSNSESMVLTSDGRGRRLAAFLAILACACFGLWKLDSSFSNDGSSFIRHHYLLLQELQGQLNETNADQRTLKGL